MEIGIFILVLIIALFLLILGVSCFDLDHDTTGIPVFMIFISLILFCGLTYTHIKVLEKVNNRPKVINYKVKELEKNTMFTITDNIGKYDPCDTVWINMNTLKIDVKDSTAMMCVIVREIK